MAIKNFIKKDTYSIIPNVSISKTNVSFNLVVYENESKNNVMLILNYSLGNQDKVFKIDKYVNSLSDFKEDEGIIFLFSDNTNEKQGFHEFTRKSVKGEKNSYSFIRESLHKESPKLIQIKDKVYEYDSSINKYFEKKDLKNTSIHFENYFPIMDKNHFELAYNYLMSLPEFENCEKA
jgi:hypothetical protein